MADHSRSLITVHKLDVHGRELWRYNGHLLHHDEVMLVLQAEFDREDIDSHGLMLRKGDRFTEYFYFDRWYNIFDVHDAATGDRKGWYCNFTRPAWLDVPDLYAEDMALDLVVFPNRQFVVVDRDEFEALDISDEERGHVIAALNELIELILAERGPFQRQDPVFDLR